MIEAIGRKRIHPGRGGPGRDGGAACPRDPRGDPGRPAEALAAAGRALDWYRSSVQRFEEDATRFGAFPSAFMGLVAADGSVEHYDGTCGSSGPTGAVLAERADPRPYWKDLGYPGGVYRSGPWPG